MNHSDIFQSRFAKLNSAQKEAVETLFGPVMVLAGPGTGKTEILAARIANILNTPETGAEAHNILCLTYTDAGTIAMRKRLIEFIGPSAHQIAIHTFHSFCNEVIQNYLPYFGKRELQAISDLEKISFLEKIVDSFDAKNPLFKKTGYFEVRRLQNLFDTMKAENWSVEDICKAADDYIADLPNREEFVYKRANATKGIQAGDPNQRLIDGEIQKMEELKAGAQAFSQYQALLAEHGKYDFQDMICWVEKAFRENEEILARYQEQFQFILVDEYQDTNGTQNQILTLLTSYWSDPNLFIVGDDDQSIYRFQGANLRNILDVYDRFQRKVKTVVLTENYRSSQNILDVSKSLIERNTERLTNVIPNLKKNLVAKNPKVADSSVQVNIQECENISHEEANIVKQIETLRNAGISLSNIAVIYNQHSQAANIIKILEQKKIPLNVKASQNVLELPLIQKVLEILRYISSEFQRPHSAERLLFKILHFDFFHLQALDIAKISVEIYKLKKQLRDEETGETIFWRSFLADTEKVQSAGVSVQEVQSAMKKLEHWIQSVPNMTIQELVETILTQSGIIQSLLEQEDNAFSMRVLSTFFNFLKSEAQAKKRLSLEEFLKTIDQMSVHKLSLPVQKILSNKDGVHFLSAHASKGLEFEFVFLIGANSDKWDKKSRSGTYSFPDTLTKSNDGDHIEEARRLFFVALTRAKEHLTVSFSAKSKENKEMESSRFVSELQESGLETEKISLSDEEIIKHELWLLQSEQKNTSPEFESAMIDEILQNYVMNVSQLNKYLKCPKSFYYETILRVPSAMNESMAFGNCIHYALEHLNRWGMEHQNQFLEKGEEKLISFFEHFLSVNEFAFTEEQLKRRREYGKEILKNYFASRKLLWNPNVKVEYSINNTSIAGVPVSGKLDKVEFLEDGTVKVVDYKTGKFSNAKEKLLPPNEEVLPNGGDYWRQVVFYKLLIDADKRNSWTMSSAEIDFVEGEKDESKVVSLPVHPEHENIVKNQIQRVYQKIKNHEFEGCGEKDCEWCNF